MRKIYFDSFRSIKDIEEQFSTKLSNEKILLAWYGGGGYDGQAVVIFKKGSKLFHVYGSHCSCYGLEDQWRPEETSPQHLRKLFFEGNYMLNFDGNREVATSFSQLLDELDGKSTKRNFYKRLITILLTIKPMNTEEVTKYVNQIRKLIKETFE